MNFNMQLDLMQFVTKPEKLILDLEVFIDFGAHSS